MSYEKMIFLWKKKNSVIALLSTAMLGAHLWLRFILKADTDACNSPLLIALVIGGIPLLAELAIKLLKKDFGADLLAGISIFTSYVLGEYLAGAIVVLMLSGGNALEDFAVRNASSALKALAKRMPQNAHRQKGPVIEDIRAEEIKIGDTLLVFPHEICPVDGLVSEGHGSMDEAYLTGEPFKVQKAPGSSVISGAVNGETALSITASKLPSDSRYAKIMEVMRVSEKNKPKIRRLGDKLGAFYAPLALIIAFIAWGISGDATRFLAVLVTATPCPLLISIPIAILGSISLAARRGIIIRNPSVLENADQCKTAIFDKTGTLTYGEPELSEILTAPDTDEKMILGLSASLERYSKHPLAGAVTSAAQKRNAALHEATEVHEVPGQGLQGVVAGRTLQITGRNVLGKFSFSGLEHLPATQEGLECIIILDQRYAATLRFRDTPRAEGLSFIRHLSPKHHLHRAMIVSGDRESEVLYLAKKVGISEVYAQKSPEEKLEIVKAETAKAATLYVGDGINDAPALLAATVGVAIGRNSDITSQAAGAVILESSLAKVDELMHIGRRMRKVAMQSAVGGIVLSLAAMFLAAGGHLTPVAGALTQEAIDILSILNALRAAFPPKALSDF